MTFSPTFARQQLLPYRESESITYDGYELIRLAIMDLSRSGPGRGVFFLRPEDSRRFETSGRNGWSHR